MKLEREFINTLSLSYGVPPELAPLSADLNAHFFPEGKKVANRGFQFCLGETPVVQEY